MAEYSQIQRRSRMVKHRMRKGQKVQRADTSYDIDGLSTTIEKSHGDVKTRALSKAIQAKLTVGSPDDTYEKEADHNADLIVQQTSKNSDHSIQKEKEDKELQTKPLLQKQEKEEEEQLQTKPLLQKQEKEEEEQLQTKPLLQKQEKEEEEQLQAKSLLQKQEKEEEEQLQAKPLLQKQEKEEEEQLQAKPLLQKQEKEEEEQLQTKPQASTVTAANGVSPRIASRIEARKGSGSHLPRSARSQMEQHFKKDLSGVRIHTDQEANQISQRLQAQAFTLGMDVYFNAGKFRPETQDGKHLLAHELTHVIQQNRRLDRKPEVLQKKCQKAPKKVNPKVSFKLSAVFKNTSAIPGYGRTHHDKVKVDDNTMVFTEKQICGLCGPKNTTESWVIYPASANIEASIPVSINKSKIEQVGFSGERHFIDKKNVMLTGFMTAADAAKKMQQPVMITTAMTRKHELHHVAYIKSIVDKALKARHGDIAQFCPYDPKDGTDWKIMMQGGWNGTVIWYSEHAENSEAQEKESREKSF